MLKGKAQPQNEALQVKQQRQHEQLSEWCRMHAVHISLYACHLVQQRYTYLSIIASISRAAAVTLSAEKDVIVTLCFALPLLRSTTQQQL
jgi:hypothetical protein